MNLGSYLGNHRTHYVKKVVFEVLQERYSKNDQIVERVACSLVTDKDLKDFVELIVDVYEAGYLKSVKDQREQLEKLGLVANIKRG